MRSAVAVGAWLRILEASWMLRVAEAAETGMKQFCLSQDHSQISKLKQHLLLNLCILSLLCLKLHSEVYFIGKPVVFHLLEGPEFNGALLAR